MSFRVLQPGLYTILVDRGRSGCRAFGVPVGGAADPVSYRLANLLLGNDPNALALEVTLVGPTLLAVDDLLCAFVGAPMSLTVDQEPKLNNFTFSLRPGQTLKVGGCSKGLRGYLAVAGGGFSAKRAFGSGSTFQPVQANDLLACSRSLRDRVPRGVPTEALFNLAYEVEVTLRVLAGPQHDWFDDDSFFNSVYIVSKESNRMGLRLDGAQLPKCTRELVSEAVAPGAVQVSHDGRPIILGIDGQTIGGYPKIAHVIRADLAIVGQLRPGQHVRFQKVTTTQAHLMSQELKQQQRHWEMRLDATLSTC